MSSRPSFFSRLKRGIFIYIIFVGLVWMTYYQLWGKYLYLVTAYCDCPICINVPKYRDGRFANGKRVYWGGVAADPRVPFETELTLVPHWPGDWFAVLGLLKGRRDFVVEDRGGKIKGRHIDLFIPDSMGGHKAALQWGRRKMRLKMNGVWAD